jgi:hypothetical protein
VNCAVPGIAVTGAAPLTGWGTPGMVLISTTATEFLTPPSVGDEQAVNTSAAAATTAKMFREFIESSYRDKILEKYRL